MASDKVGPQGITEEEAKEFHSLYMQYATLYALVAVVAHILVWMWRPWFGAAKPMLSSLEGAGQSIVSTISFLV